MKQIKNKYKKQNLNMFTIVMFVYIFVLQNSLYYITFFTCAWSDDIFAVCSVLTSDSFTRFRNQKVPFLFLEETLK